MIVPSEGNRFGRECPSKLNDDSDRGAVYVHDGRFGSISVSVCTFNHMAT